MNNVVQALPGANQGSSLSQALLQGPEFFSISWGVGGVVGGLEILETYLY